MKLETDFFSSSKYDVFAQYEARSGCFMAVLLLLYTQFIQPCSLQLTFIRQNNVMTKKPKYAKYVASDRQAVLYGF